MRRSLVLVALVISSAAVARAQDEEYQEPQPYGLREAAREGRSIQLGRGVARVIPEIYTVRRGDTLWDLCDLFFDNPWYWPRLWSFNDRITNPNWIYPGDPLRMRRPGDEVPVTPGPRPTAPGIPDSVFLRDSGFVERDQYRRAGTIVGSPDERSLLSTYDGVYVEFEDAGQVQPGREYAVFKQVRGVRRGPDGEEVGSIVEILGTVRIDSYDRDRNVARGVIVESIQPIERGNRVSMIERTFTVTASVRNTIDLNATVLTSLTPVQNFAEQQIVYLDRGGNDGVRLGNRFFVVRRGDAYQRSRNQDDLRAGFPYEVIGELRVVGLRRTTATTLVVRSTREIRSGDRAEMRRGY